jgi:hypothetical protein
MPRSTVTAQSAPERLTASSGDITTSANTAPFADEHPQLASTSSGPTSSGLTSRRSCCPPVCARDLGWLLMLRAVETSREGAAIAALPCTASGWAAHQSAHQSLPPFCSLLRFGLTRHGARSASRKRLRLLAFRLYVGKPRESYPRSPLGRRNGFHNRTKPLQISSRAPVRAPVAPFDPAKSRTTSLG